MGEILTSGIMKRVAGIKQCAGMKEAYEGLKSSVVRGTEEVVG